MIAPRPLRSLVRAALLRAALLRAALLRAALLRAALLRRGRRVAPASGRAWRRALVSVVFTVITARYPARSNETAAAAFTWGLLVLGKPGHQRPQPGADLLDLLGVLGLAALEEVRLARVELLDQFAGERAVLDLA